jgi:hypothetical protein
MRLELDTNVVLDMFHWRNPVAAGILTAAHTPQRYQCRRPERTLWYRIVQTHLETWLELASGEAGEAPPAHVERIFRRYLECGILAHGFARAYCDECQHDFLIAYSCKCRGVCPSCNTRRMAETAAHLVDDVFPPLPVRQLVLAAPRRLRCFLQCGGQTHRPLYIGKPTFAIEASRHLVGIVLIDCFGF